MSHILFIWIKFTSDPFSGFLQYQAIEKRISVYSQVPVQNGELIQVLRLALWSLFGCIFHIFMENWYVLSIKANICRSTGIKRVSSTDHIMTTLLIKYVFHLPCAFIASHHISFDINSTIYGELLCAKGGSILLQFNIKAEVNE